MAQLIQQTVGYEGELKWDVSKPDGTPRKLMDVSKLNAMGWKASIGLPEGVRLVYEEYKNSVKPADVLNIQ